MKVISLHNECSALKKLILRTEQLAKLYDLDIDKNGTLWID
jgi:hypothetical protein